jgi:vanillate O-demethylase ferredoxin subunit
MPRLGLFGWVIDVVMLNGRHMMDTFELVIRDIQNASPLIRSFTLEPAQAGSLPAFAPGSHLQVQIPDLNDHRCYSLISLDADTAQGPTCYRLGVRLEDNSSGGSRFMHSLKVGDTLRVAGPKNDFPLHAAAEGETETVLIAGGIGITPIASMAAALHHQGRPYQLHYAGRSVEQLAFLDELSALSGPALRHYADDSEGRFCLNTLLDGLSKDQHIYVCGPKGMIDAVIEACKQRGWPGDHVHFELFVTAAPQEGDQPFEVELRQTGVTLQIPADKTIVDVMEEQGLDPMIDCKRGECGVCTCDVIEGEVDHRDYFLSDSEKASNKVIQICISRAKTPRLVLDL